MSASSKRKPRRRNGLIDIANGLLSLLVFGVLGVAALLVFAAHQFYSAGPLKEDAIFAVERGSGLSTISQRLEEQGLVSNRLIFQFGGMALKKQAEINFGEYNIKAGATMADILKEITEGKPILYGVTVPEGFTVFQVISRLKADQNLTGDIAEMPAEGSILPQTYNYDRNTPRADVLARMQADMATQLAEVWKNRDPDLPLKTPEELVTLASIVEKETGVASERPQVAAVFINRLKQHMRLQSDPTIIYGITKGAALLGRELKKSEIEAKTPYNTYQIDGLPPGPIANPGIDALKATANPAKTDDLYFVAATAIPSGGHYFSATYAEHRKNVLKYRKALKAAAIAAEAEADAAKDAIEAEQAGQPAEPAPAAP